MITKNPMQLKAFIKNKAAEKHISAQLVMQNYMLERLLERISLSPYKNNFILKGGFLISAIVGLDTRATMDLDTTIKGFTLTHEAIRKIFTEICAVQIADDVQFEVIGISDIRETDDYPGIRVALKANYPPISVPLTVDVTTGDMITPREVEYTFSLLFDDRTISILAYNLETVLAEKLETVLSRNIANTRPRDYYDVHILYALRGAECDKATLRRALERTTQKRGSGTILTDYPEIMKEIRESDTLRRLWEKYSREYEYAKDISFDDTCNTIFFLNGKRNIVHAHTSKSLSFAFAAAFFGAAVFFDCPSLSCARTEGRCLRSGRSRRSSLLIKAKTPCLSLTEERYSVLYGSNANSRSCSLLDAIRSNHGDTSTTKCVPLGLLGACRD